MSQQRSNWCRLCGKQLFYDSKDKNKGRTNQIFFMSVIVIVIGLIAYLFIEMIITPVVNLLKL